MKTARLKDALIFWKDAFDNNVSQDRHPVFQRVTHGVDNTDRLHYYVATPLIEHVERQYQLRYQYISGMMGLSNTVVVDFGMNITLVFDVAHNEPTGVCFQDHHQRVTTTHLAGHLASLHRHHIPASQLLPQELVDIIHDNLLFVRHQWEVAHSDGYRIVIHDNGPVCLLFDQRYPRATALIDKYRLYSHKNVHVYPTTRLPMITRKLQRAGYSVEVLTESAKLQV